MVQQGDTLSGIARRLNISLTDLQRANCLPDPSIIYYGQILVIPPGSSLIAQTPAAVLTAISNSGNASLCPNPDVRITNPLSGTTFGGVINFFGSARGSRFAGYELEFQRRGSPDWIRTGASGQPVMNGYLGRFDPNPSQLQSGNYFLRLRVVDSSGQTVDSCIIGLVLQR